MLHKGVTPNTVKKKKGPHTSATHRYVIRYYQFHRVQTFRYVSYALLIALELFSEKAVKASCLDV